MPVENFGVTIEMVTGKLPVNASRISATTRLSTVNVSDFIERASGRIVAAMKARGLDPANLDDDTTSQARGAVEQGAIAMCLERLSRAGSPAHTRATEAYEQVAQMFERGGQGIAEQPNAFETTVDTRPSNPNDRGEFVGDYFPW